MRFRVSGKLTIRVRDRVGVRDRIKDRNRVRGRVRDRVTSNTSDDLTYCLRQRTTTPNIWEDYYA